MKKIILTLFKLYQSLFVLISLLSCIVLKAENFKFKFQNTSKTKLTVYSQIFKSNGSSRVHLLIKLEPSEVKIKALKIDEGDTICFYATNSENQTTPLLKKSYEKLKMAQEGEISIPLIIPEKESSNFESLESLGLQLEHNKVLNFLVKADTNMVANLSFLEDNFKNVYPLGTFIFVDTKTNRLLLPPLEPSFWNENETYLTIQDSIDEYVNANHQVQGGIQIAYFLSSMLSSLKMDHNWELNFKGKISLLRWRPNEKANIYQIFSDKSVVNFLQNCFNLIDDPDLEFHHYKLYFLSSYERIDDFEIFGKQFYSWDNESNFSLNNSNPIFKLVSSNVGFVYSKQKSLTNYFSVQNAVMRTKAYDFTPQLFAEFKTSTRKKILEGTTLRKNELAKEIMSEYQNLINYNPNPKSLSLANLTKYDSIYSLYPILTTIKNIDPYCFFIPDTTRKFTENSWVDIDSYNNKVKLFNSHLSAINVLINHLDALNYDLDKLSAKDKNSELKSYSDASSSDLMKEIEVSTSIIRKD